MRWFSTLARSFQVRRQMPELIRPARPTPRETKFLSDIDDQSGLRLHIPLVSFYKRRMNYDGSSDRKDDPVKVIKAALAETLVSYYPFAGRLREGDKNKLAVDCTGEGVLFVEADADVTLEDLGMELPPSFHCLEELLYDVPGSSGILNSPLLLIQVIRLRCGGFVYTLRLNHTMSDGVGIVQFQNAVAEIARGASALSITPVWKRELLNARDPPRVSCIHREYIAAVANTPDPISSESDLVQRYFYFGPTEISTVRNLLPINLRRECSNFDVLTAWIWRCRTRALQPNPKDEVKVMVLVNGRPRFNPPLPEGYYGNVIATPVALTTAEELINNPLEYAVKLVMMAKSEVTEEYMKSVADLMVLKGRPGFPFASTFVVSDARRLGLDEIDFGWGKPIYAGAGNVPKELVGLLTYYTSKKNKEGEKGTVVQISLPKFAMERFAEEIDRVAKKNTMKEDYKAIMSI